MRVVELHWLPHGRGIRPPSPQPSPRGRGRELNLAASRCMSSPLVFDLPASPFDGPAVVPVPLLHGTADTVRDPQQPKDSSTPPQSIFALHLVNGEHYSGAERVQDLLAR